MCPERIILGCSKITYSYAQAEFATCRLSLLFTSSSIIEVWNQFLLPIPTPWDFHMKPHAKKCILRNRCGKNTQAAHVAINTKLAINIAMAHPKLCKHRANQHNMEKRETIDSKSKYDTKMDPVHIKSMPEQVNPNQPRPNSCRSRIPRQPN